MSWRVFSNKDGMIHQDEFVRAVTEQAIEDQVKILEWAMKLCYSGSTPAMIRRALHNKLVEITGEGERA